ncbi:uncharacterized protein LOC143469714 [Clavelina lepadiformis]|uniref:uncharacterized protein LOC143469710 n=1 Tax=Clavelina lepadiformis TaxID=159417 RepID=UPI0040424331
MNKSSKNEKLYPCGLQDKQWSWLKPGFSGKVLFLVFSSILLALMGSSARGELFLFAVMLWKNWDDFYFFYPRENNDSLAKVDDSFQSERNSVNVSEASKILSQNSNNFLNKVLEDYYLQDVYIQVPMALLTSYLVFFVVGGYLQWNYYIKKRDKAEEWKCQPQRFLTRENERHEIYLGAVCLLVNGTFSGILSTYVKNGGALSKVYFDVNKYGFPYFIVSTIVYFLLQDAASYYYHRMLHWPFFYRNFHKWHHRYHSPTAFSAVALHPVESVVFQFLLLLPLFFVPLHFVSVAGCFYYLYYYGLIDHSGIDMESIWPWQPPVRFHDDHHKYFHCNFGFNTLLFDRFHDTLRRTDRKYGEGIFGGKGSPAGEKAKKA